MTLQQSTGSLIATMRQKYCVRKRNGSTRNIATPKLKQTNLKSKASKSNAFDSEEAEQTKSVEPNPVEQYDFGSRYSSTCLQDRRTSRPEDRGPSKNSQ